MGVRNLNVMLKPVSGSCDLRCEYCFYRDEMEKRGKDSFGFMGENTLKDVIRKVLEESDTSCVIGFQGGEPTLRGIDFFCKAVEYQRLYNRKGLAVCNIIQTNGYGLTEEFLDFFAENHFLVGVSLDGDSYMHDSFRKGRDGQGTYEKVLHNIRKIQERSMEYNILTVVNKKTAKHAARIYREYKKLGFQYLQFIPCLNPLGEEDRQYPFGLTPQAYGKFLKELFDVWYQDRKSGGGLSIQLFDNYRMILRGECPEMCGMSGGCDRQYIIEADGQTYPCDFYVLDGYQLGEFACTSIDELEERRKSIQFRELSRKLPEKCAGCEYISLCQGGCRRYREPWESGRSRYHLNRFCEEYKDFFAYTLDRLVELSR
jgi:uncharacterized protein